MSHKSINLGSVSRWIQSKHSSWLISLNMHLSPSSLLRGVLLLLLKSLFHMKPRSCSIGHRSLKDFLKPELLFTKIALYLLKGTDSSLPFEKLSPWIQNAASVAAGCKQTSEIISCYFSGPDRQKEVWTKLLFLESWWIFFTQSTIKEKKILF